MNNHIVIVICNSWSHLQNEFVHSLLSMQDFFHAWVRNEDRKDTVSIIMERDFSIEKMRNKTVEDALKMEATHILFLDIDMSFPPETIVMMLKDLEDNKDMKIEAITGLYTWKQTPYLPHVFSNFDEETKKFKVCGQFPLDSLFEVEGAGMGCVMIKSKVFKRTRKPYFAWKDYGEDLYFFHKAKPKMLLDPRIKCKHYSTVGVSIDDYIDYNGLKKCDNNFVAKPSQLNKIENEHKVNNLHQK